MTNLFSRKRSSSLALAIALATGSAVALTAVLPAEASAQRSRDRDRDRDRDRGDENDGGGYSDEFRAAYVPLDEALKADGADVAALRPQIDGLAALLNTNDEKIAGGGLIYNAGIGASDRALQLQGMELMIASSKVPAESIARYNFIAYQLSNAQNDFLKARRYLQGAIDNNFTTAEISAPDLEIAMFENFVSANELNASYEYLSNLLEAKEAEGEAVPEQWYRRGLSVSYKNESVPQVYDFTAKWISAFPSENNWRDAVNIARNLNEFKAAEILDLFRLSRRVNALQDPSDYDYYVEAADARRLPKEVQDVVEEGYAAGIISRDNLFITEALGIAESRIAADRRDLPELESDANAADAGLRTVIAAGDAFLSYNDFSKAAGFYQKAAGIPDADMGLVNTRLGISLAEMGRYDAARQAFDQVVGNRLPIAKLWLAYINQKEGAATPADPSIEPSAPATAL